MQQQSFNCAKALLFFLLAACNSEKTPEVQGAPSVQQATKAKADYASLPFPQNPDEAVKRIREGNTRFVNNEALNPNRSDEHKILQAKGQTPFIAVMGCSDSRVPSEIIFDQGLGDVFVVRTAGQVMADASVGSLEFATAVLGVKAILVLGHEKCGAVMGALGADPLPGKIEYLVSQIRPAVYDYIGNLSKLEEAAHKNVEYQIQKLKASTPVLSEAVKSGKIKILGGMYNLSTGKVELFDEGGIALP